MSKNFSQNAFSLFAFSLGFLALSGAAFAQAITPTADPSRVREQIERDTQPRISTPADISTTPDVQAPPGAEKISFVLKEVNVEGATKVSQRNVKAAYAHLIGKKITLVQVYEIANKITKIYRDHGYILSRAIVPQQEISNGVVTIRVVEGFVSSFNIQGETYGAKREIEAFARKLRDTGALTARNLERYLPLMNDLPGIKVRSVLAPSKTVPGGADMTLVVEQDRFSGIANIDNYGNTYLGEERITLGGQANSLFRSSDQWNATYLTAPDHRELFYYGLGFKHNVGSEGTKFGINGSYTVTDPSLPAALGGNLGPEGQSFALTFAFDHPFVRSRAFNLFGTLSYDITNNKTNYAPGLGGIETEDDQRIVRAASTMTYLDGLAGYNTASATASQGLEMFGSSEEGDADLSRAAGDPGFTKFALELTRLQRIWGPITGFVGVSGQYSLDPLLASEEFGYGGSDYGRGFDSSEITGDHGVAGKVEIAYNRSVEKKYLDDYQVYTFYDLGAVWNKDPGAGEDVRNSGASTGIGTRLNFNEHVNGDAFVAKTLTREVPSRGAGDEDNWRFKFSINSNF